MRNSKKAVITSVVILSSALSACGANEIASSKAQAIIPALKSEAAPEGRLLQKLGQMGKVTKTEAMMNTICQ